MDIAVNLRSASKSYDRLFHDLLYLPLYDIPEHRKRVLTVIIKYKPASNRFVKYNVFQVLNCYREYPGIPYFQPEIQALCRKIARSCVEDIEYQYKNYPTELIFGHIDLAFRHIHAQTDIRPYIDELNRYARKNSDFAECKFFEDISHPDYPPVEP